MVLPKGKVAKNAAYRCYHRPIRILATVLSSSLQLSLQLSTALTFGDFEAILSSCTRWLRCTAICGRAQQDRSSLTSTIASSNILFTLFFQLLFRGIGIRTNIPETILLAVVGGALGVFGIYLIHVENDLLFRKI